MDRYNSLLLIAKTASLSCWVFFVFGLIIDQRWNKGWSEMLRSLEWREACWVALVMVPMVPLTGAVFGTACGLLIRMVNGQPPRVLQWAVEVTYWAGAGSVIHYLVLGVLNREVDDFLLVVFHT